MKPDKPIAYNEFYLDAMTGGSPELPAPVTPEQHYLAHLAGITVTLPQPIILRDMFLAKICGMEVNIPTYIPGKFPRKFAYYAKAAGQDVDVPQPITREEMYWFDYVSGQPTPSEQEYAGAVPVTFTANGQPLLDYLISGNTVQNGTPTPDNPIQPQGTGERTENLFSEPLTNGYTLNGTTGLPSTYDKRCATLNPIDVSGLQNVTITFSATLSRTRVIYSLFDNSTLIRRVTAIFSGTSIDVSDGNKLYICFYDTADTETVSGNDISNLMLNSGSTALPYEPYGYKIPISSAGQTTPVYLGEAETTRRIRKLELTGDENWVHIAGQTTYSAYYRVDIGALRTHLQVMESICTHYQYVIIASATTDIGFGIQNSTTANRDFLAFRPYAQSAESELATWKLYLQQQYANGTPVTVWYVLATEETAVVNEPLMKIGDYADTLSMEQAGVEIPTERGTNTLDVLTDVKPSEVYIKYKS